MKLKLFKLLIITVLYNNTPLVAYYSPCESQIESSFFNRKYLEEAFVLNEISQSSWYLIYTDISKRNPEIRQLVEIYAKEETRVSPAKTTAEKQEIRAKAMDKALYQVLNDVLSQYQLSGGSNVSRRVYNHLKERQRSKLVSCLGPYFSDTPSEEKKPQHERTPNGITPSTLQSSDPSNQKNEARMNAYDLQIIYQKYKVPQEAAPLPGSQRSSEANQSIFENYVVPKILKK